MHEASLMSDLLSKIEQIALDAKAEKITRVCVKLGALAHMTPEHFRGHFEEAAAGTVAEGATLEIEQADDQSDPHAQDVLLTSVDVAA